VESEVVKGVVDLLGRPINVNHLDHCRGQNARERRRALRGLASPVKIRRPEVLGRSNILVAKVAGRELVGNGLHGTVQRLLEQGEVRTMPCEEEDRRMRAVSAKAARGLPVGGAGHAVPGLVRHAVDAGDLIVRLQLVLVEALVVCKAEKQQIELVWEITLEVSQLATERDGSCVWWTVISISSL